MEVLREGYRILFSRGPPLSDQPLPMPSYSPSSIRGKALEKEFQDLLLKGAVEQAPQSPGFYSRLFVVQKDSGAWRPIIDLSTLNTFIVSRHFHMETPQSVLRSIRQGDWMISLDLQDAYLQVPIHLESRRTHIDWSYRTLKARRDSTMRCKARLTAAQFQSDQSVCVQTQMCLLVMNQYLQFRFKVIIRVWCPRRPPRRLAYQTVFFM